MSTEFSSILQTYLYYRNQGHRAASGANVDDWPTEFPPLQNAWAKEVGMLGVSAKADDFEFEDLSVEVGCVGYRVGDRQFWVPAPLCAFLPRPDVMSKLYDAALARRLFADSSICISGSSVLMGVVPRVGDLDLFEYVKKDAVKNELLDPEPQYRSGSVVCKSVRVGQTHNGGWPLDSWELDEKDIFPEKMRTYAAKYLDKHNFCKIDMIGSFGEDHIGEISNIIFKHNDEFDFGTEAFPSFPHQEVVTGDDCPSPDRYSLKNYGDYVFWLAGEVESKSENLQEFLGKPTLSSEFKKLAIKVSKRAMILAAMIGENIAASWFSKILANKESRKYAAQSAIDCINPLIRMGGDAEKLATPALEIATKEMKEISKMADEELKPDELLDQLSSLVDHFDNLCYPNRTLVE